MNYITDIMANQPRARPVALVVLDGWGYRAQTDGNAIALARTPTWDALWNRGSRTLLEDPASELAYPPVKWATARSGT